MARLSFNSDRSMTTPPLDLSVRLAWAFANQEAKSGGHRTIEPGHLLLGCLKLIDSTFEPPSKTSVSPAESTALLGSLGLAREQSGLVATAIKEQRRALRKRLAVGAALDVEGLLHRSEECRGVFKRAADRSRFEGSTCVSLRHFVPELMALDGKGLPVAAKDARAEQGSKGAERGVCAKGRSTTSVLDALGRDLTKLAREGRLPEVVGRDVQMIQLARILHRTSKRNAMIVGDAGVGKTAIVEGLAMKLAARGDQDALSRLRIVQVNVADLVAGTTYRGDMEQRLKLLVAEATSDPNVVLFLDEIHLIVRTGAGSGGAMDIANVLKPALGREELRCIGATTTEEFEKYIKTDSALLRRFQVLKVPEPSQADALEICRSWAKRIEIRQEVEVSSEAVGAAVSLSVRFLPSRRLPDKAIDLLENAAVMVKVSSLSPNRGIPVKRLQVVGSDDVLRALREASELVPPPGKS